MFLNKKNSQNVKNLAEKLYKTILISKLPLPDNNKKYIAFTLAEVMITLLIIGIVASIIIPSLLINIQEANYKIVWKKTYSEFDQATKKIMIDNGGTMKGYLTVTRSLYPLYKKYLNNIKVGGYDMSNTQTTLGDFGNLMYFTTTNPRFSYKQLNGTDASTGYFDDGQFIFNNGIFVAIQNCTGQHPDNILWVDVNGYHKKPNVIGKDIFGAQVLDTGIKALGSTGDGFENTCTDIGIGWGCSAKYLVE